MPCDPTELVPIFLHLPFLPFVWIQNKDVLSWEGEGESGKKASKRIRCWGWGACPLPTAIGHVKKRMELYLLGIKEERENRTYS